MKRFDQGGLAHLRAGLRDRPLGLRRGSLHGAYRNWVGVENTCSLQADEAIERMRPLVKLGGYIPCPDPRLPQDCKYDLVRYYGERMRAVFQR